MENQTEAAYNSIYKDIREILIFEEGDRKDLYDDETSKTVSAPVGKITGGIGHNFSDNGIDPELRDFLFNRDLLRSIRDARDVLGDQVFFNLDHLRMIAVVCMAFQFGAYRFAKFKRAVDAIKKGDWVTAECEVLDSEFYREDAPARAKRVSLLLRGVNPYGSIFIRGQALIKSLVKR